MLKRCALAIVAVLPSVATGSEVQWYSQVAGNATLRFVSVPEGELTLGRAQELAKEFLSSPAGQKSLAQFVLATNDFDLSKLSLHGATTSEGSYDYSNALAELKSGYPFRGPVARVLKFRAWAILDYRADDRHFSEELLTGKQSQIPLAAGASTYRVLDFAITGIEIPALEIFLQSSPSLSVADATLEARELLRETWASVIDSEF